MKILDIAFSQTLTAAHFASEQFLWTNVSHVLWTLGTTGSVQGRNVDVNQRSKCCAYNGKNRS